MSLVVQFFWITV